MAQRVFCCLIAGWIALWTWGSRSEMHAQTPVQASPNDSVISQTVFAHARILVIVYSATTGARLDKSTCSTLQNTCDLIREFYWRNSRCRLFLEMTFYEINDYKRSSFYPRSGVLGYASVADEINTHIPDVPDYNLILVLYPQYKRSRPIYHECISESTCFASLPLSLTGISYPSNQANVNSTLTWPIMKAIQSALAEWLPNVAAHHDTPHYFINDSYPAIASLLRSTFDISHSTLKLSSSKDQDRDGLPDNDPDLPMDEHRFQSDSTSVDTDHDGVDDLQEYACGMYRSASPIRPDSDFDGLPDALDPYPVLPTATEIPKFTVEFDGDLQNWFWLTDIAGFSSSNFPGKSRLKGNVYMNWDDDMLSLAVTFNIPVELTVEMDMGYDGWNHGANNYRFVVDPFSKRFIEVRALDMSSRIRKLTDQPGQGMWDDEPEYYSTYGRIVDELNVQLRTVSTEKLFGIRIGIPASELPDGMLRAGNQLGIRLHFQSTVDDNWASVFTPYCFHRITLK